jgi:hypothetical protein
VATAETARLIASLEMRDSGFSRTANSAIGQVNKLDTTLGRIGDRASKGLSTAASRLKRIGLGLGAAVTGGLLIAGRQGLDDLATLEDAITAVDGAIAQVGLTGKVTGTQIARWANEIEAASDAAFDDKAITAATENLIRYGKIGPQNLRKTMEVMTDLAVKTGGVSQASTLLGKALADPTKAQSRLLRSGVLLTDQQQKQITKLYEAGKVGKAQALVLDLIAKKTDGAAKASKGPYRDAINLLTDAFEDGRKALAEGFMPLIQRFAGEASEFFGKQSTIDMIRNFGNNLADAAESGIEFAKKIPWAAIGDGLGKAAGFVGKLFDAFRSMPPEMQATLIALAGLDKLSGGAISGIVGELGKGLIKGVLGMTAGIVNLRAARVTGLGAVPATGAGAAGAGAAGTNVFGSGKLATLAQLVSKALVVGLVAELASGVDDMLGGLAKDLKSTLKINDFWNSIGVPEIKAGDISWPFGPKNTPTILPEVFGGNGLLGGTAEGANTTGITKNIGTFTREQQATTDKVETVATNTAGTKEQVIVSGKAARAGLSEVARAATTAGVLASFAAINAGSRVAAAIAAKDMSVVTNTSVVVNVTAANVTKEVVIQERWGNGNGSAGGGNGANRLNPGIA